MRETNEDTIENMDYIDEDDAGRFDAHIDRSSRQTAEGNFENSNPHQIEASTAGLFN